MGVSRDMEVEVLSYYNNIINDKLMSLYCNCDGIGSFIIKTYRNQNFEKVDDEMMVVNDCLDFVTKKGTNIFIRYYDGDHYGEITRLVEISSSGKPTFRSPLKRIQDRLFRGRELDLDLLEIYTYIGDRRVCFMFFLVPHEK